MITILSLRITIHIIIGIYPLFMIPRITVISKKITQIKITINQLQSWVDKNRSKSSSNC